MQNYKINFSQEQLQFIVNVLNDLPTKSNAYPLLQEIYSQVAVIDKAGEVPSNG
jgi:hypothetical protein